MIARHWFTSALALSTFIGATAAFAGETVVPPQYEERYEEYDRGSRTEVYEREERIEYRYPAPTVVVRPRTAYVIIGDRPVRRVVYAAPGGGYYYISGGRRLVVREPHFSTYPSRYYYPDGRRRVGVRMPY